MKARYFFIAAVVLALVSIIAMRSNSIQAAELTDQIQDKDSQGQDVAGDIEALRSFVFTHMNSSTKFELTASYERATAAASQAAQSGSDDIYSQAQEACGQQAAADSVSQVQCVQRYLEQNLEPGSSSQALEPPDRSLYNYAFVSPTWTPDTAGLTLLGALLLAITALVLYVKRSFRQG